LIFNEETLTVENVGATIARTFPEFQGVRVELLDEGWDFRVFEVDESWLFRFPRRKTSVAKLKKEREILSVIGDWVSLPVPNHEYYHEPKEGSIRAFAGYRKLPGIPGDISKLVDRDMVARQLGMFLERLHTYPVDKAREAGVPEVRNLIEHWRDKSRDQLQRLDGLNVNRDLLRRYLENDAPLISDRAPCLVHNDLWAEHILIDIHSGGASGIIDWGDTIVSDPAIDFACLYAWYGESWLENVLTHYTLEVDPELLSRSRYLGTCLAIHNITLGRDQGHARWIDAGYAALQLIHST
jgi:aminoglycoside phosphotransferase (APT) family kinase protein